MKKSKKIFIGICETSGVYGRLYKGLRELGVDCFFAQLVPNAHDYTYTMPCDNILTRLARNYYKKNKLLYNIIKGIVFVWAITCYDTFVLTNDHFFGDQTKDTARELKLLKLLHKKSVYMNLGWFTRLPYAQGTYVHDKKYYKNGKTNVKKFVEEIENRLKAVKAVEDNVEVYLNYPPEAQIGNRKFISLVYIDNVIDLTDKNDVRTLETDGLQEDGHCVRILHAPSNVKGKGTYEIRRCIKELKKKYEIEYVEVIDMPNDRVLQEVQKCDFVIDQVYSDTFMASFPMEAAFYGKPAVVCGYFATDYKKYYPKGPVPPGIFVLPDALYCTVEELIRNKDLREKKGRQMQKFVRKYMNSRAVAKRFYKAINGDIDPVWIVDPAEIDYINGWGVNEGLQKQIIKDIYAEAGIEKMGTTGRPLLTKKILEIVNEK